MTLTPEQIKNWRMLFALDLQIGAYAQIAPAEEIQKLAAHFQKQLDDFEEQNMPLINDQMRNDL